MRRFLEVLVAVTVTLVASGGRASANVQNFYGAGSRGPALANALTAGAAGPEAALYNPAALARSGPARLVTGLSLFRLDLKAGSAGRGGEDVLNVSVGLSGLVPLGGILRDRLSFGLLLQLPTEDARLVRIFLPSARDPYFLPYTNATERAVVTPALALELVPGAAIGFSLDIFPFDSPNVQAGGVGRLGDFELNGDLALLTDFIPRVGLWFDGDAFGEQWARWEAGFTYRDAFDAVFSLPVALDVGFPVDLVVSGVSAFVPRQVAGGFAFELDEHWQLFGELAWQQWSQLPSPRVRLEINGLDGLLPIDELDAIQSIPVNPDLDDTVSPRVAVEWREGEGGVANLSARLGYAYEPSPGTPREDPMLFTNARHVITAGLQVGGDFELDGSAIELSLSLFFQAHVLESQRRLRPPPIDDPTAAPEPVTGGGWVGAGGVFFEVGF